MPEKPSVEPESLFEKFKNNALLMNEGRFDALTRDERDWGPSAMYLFIACVIYYVFATPVQLFLTGLTTTSMYEGMLGLTGIALTLVLMVFSFFVSLVAVYIWGAIAYVLLKLFGGKADMLKTVQVMIYGNTPYFLFGWIPCINVIVWFLGLANVVIGQKQVHDIPLWKAIVALIVIPLAIIAVLALVLALFFVSVFNGVVPVSG